MCKFCQIIKNAETLSYLDEKVAVFDDSRPAAQYHLLMCPVEHIKSINTLKKEDLPLLEYMKSKALEIIKKKMDKNGHTFDEK
jgi:diadenosine tetraphosphate (Ap4A) HIT family hydrolase